MKTRGTGEWNRNEKKEGNSGRGGMDDDLVVKMTGEGRSCRRLTAIETIQTVFFFPLPCGVGRRGRRAIGPL